jgi:hypothetical protein
MAEKARSSTPQVFDQWREADAAARAAEKDVLAASLEALDGKRRPPSLKEREHAKSLRAAADAMLQSALAALNRVAQRQAPPGRVSIEGPDSRPWE